MAAALAGLGLVMAGFLGLPARVAGPISVEHEAERASQTTAISSVPASLEARVVRDELAERFSSQPLALRRAGGYLGLPIRDVPVATWILAKNPETTGNAGLDYGRADPAELRIVRIRLVKPDGGRLFIDKLERIERLTTEGLHVGSPMFLAYPELGLAAHGEILSIEACPPIPPRPGPDHCLITSKFVHEAATLVELHVAGLAAPILVTPNHPLWSEDRREFVRADHLVPGERLRSALDESLIVTAVVPRERPAPVYNLEVDGEHVYFVSPAGVLAHNNSQSAKCDGDAVAPTRAVLDDAARFAQSTYSEVFSAKGIKAYSDLVGKRVVTIDDLADAIRSGAVDPAKLRIDFIQRGGTTLILNTRTAEALRRARISRSKWSPENRTGNKTFEDLLDGQLGRNYLDDCGIANPISQGLNEFSEGWWIQR